MKTRKPAFEDWFDAQLGLDPAFNLQVEEKLQAMRLEQDLVALREARGMSQGQLARTLGVSQPAIAKLESGKVRNLGLRTLIRAVFALGGTLKIQVVKGPSRTRQKALSAPTAGKRSRAGHTPTFTVERIRESPSPQRGTRAQASARLSHV